MWSHVSTCFDSLAAITSIHGHSWLVPGLAVKSTGARTEKSGGKRAYSATFEGLWMSERPC